MFYIFKTRHENNNLWHLAKDRRDNVTGKRGKNNNSDKRDNSSKNANYASDTSEERVDFVTFQSFNASVYPNLNCNKWIIDSGCTSHMTYDRKNLITFKPIKGKVYLAGRNNVVESKGIGSVKVRMQNDLGTESYIIILYCTMSYTFPVYETIYYLL